MEDRKPCCQEAARQDRADQTAGERGPTTPRSFSRGDPIGAASQHDAEENRQSEKGEAEDGGGGGGHLRRELNHVQDKCQALGRGVIGGGAIDLHGGDSSMNLGRGPSPSSLLHMFPMWNQEKGKDEGLASADQKGGS